MSIDIINKDKEFEEIKKVFVETFSKEPWLDEWNDEKQLNLYIHDLIDQNNSLSLGLYIFDEILNKEVLVGLALGRIMHFYKGKQFRIDEFCIYYKYQNKGLGVEFMDLLFKKMKEIDISFILLDTDKSFNAYSFYHKVGFKDIKDSIGLIKKII